LLRDRNEFRPYVMQMCGGFHPDWCFSWEGDGVSTHIHLCLGCGDLEEYVDGKKTILCSMFNLDKFEAILSRHLRRPLP
jgi:hypothetical protein